MNNIIAIRKTDAGCARQCFSDLMSKTEVLLNQCAQASPAEIRTYSPSRIERFVYDCILQSSEGSPFRKEEIKWISGSRFPDIIAENYYGIEVKSTVGDHWRSTGSSIVESTRMPHVEDIYMIFGKLGGVIPEFRARPYSAVLYDIAVTHCPRYLIDMELPEGDTIFDKIGIPYDVFRSSDNSISQVRHYYRNKAIASGKKEMPWWIGSDTGEQATSITLRFWRDLPVMEKRLNQAKIFVLFPEVIASDFDNASLWLCTSQSILNPHMRDTFTAGGRLKLADGKPLERTAPRICQQLLTARTNILRLFSDPDFIRNDVAEFNPGILQSGDPYAGWLQQVADITPDDRLVDWFNSNTTLL